MVFKIKIISIGKTKELWLEQAIQEYAKRLTSMISFDFVWAKDDNQLVELARKETSFICLDLKGKQMTSEQFSTFLTNQLEANGSRLTFLIGGPEGLPSKLKEHRELISLSPMTFTHQITRLILVEQIYRALEIAKGTKYHK